MKVGICSDIHIHRADQAEQIRDLVEHINAQRDLDLLVCAGDLSHRTAEVRAFLASITLACPRAWVPGNHDLWVIESESELDHPDHRYRTVLPAVSREAGWHYLPDGPLDLPNHAISVVGTTGWFTGPGFSEWHDAPADHRDEQIAARMAAELEAAILAVDPARRMVIVTHHLPHPSCLETGEKSEGRVNIHVSEVVRRHAARVDLVVHGHRHRRYEPIAIEGTTYVAHPFGYPGQHARLEDGYRTVQID